MWPVPVVAMEPDQQLGCSPVTSKKGMSPLQIMRFMGFGSYKTAWMMRHKVRTTLVEEDTEQLGGIVEVDETFVGGKGKNRRWRKRGGGDETGGIGSGKIPVAGAVRHKGNLIARDQWVGYKNFGSEYSHAFIDHSKGQYVIGTVHTRTIEGFWSIFKHGIVGTFHKVSRKYTSLYVAEFQFCYNNRENRDTFGTAISGCRGAICRK